MRALRWLRHLLQAIRLGWWRIRTVVRLRLHRCAVTITIGRNVSYDALPVLKLRPEGGGGRLDITIGEHVNLGSLLFLDYWRGEDATLAIGAHSSFEHAVRLQLWGGSIDIGEQCEIRDNALLKASHAGAQLRLGQQVKVGRGVAVHCHTGVDIRDRATLAERVTIVDSFHDVDGSDVWTMYQPLGVGPVTIGENVLVLSGAVIVHGTTIGSNAVVSANALVGTGSYDPGVVLLGNPARTVRRLSPTDREPAGG